VCGTGDALEKRLICEPCCIARWGSVANPQPIASATPVSVPQFDLFA